MDGVAFTTSLRGKKMEAVLSQYDQLCIRELIRLGLFTHVVPEKLPSSKGVIVALCSDGHQFQDTYGHIATICREQLHMNCIHPVTLNGGALLMSGDLMPEEEKLDGDRMFRNVLVASQLKGVKDVLLYTHFPCGIARKVGLGVIDQGIRMMAAKKRLKEANPEFNIYNFFHVHGVDSPDKRRTYFMPRKQWQNEDLVHEILHIILKNQGIKLDL